MALNYLFLVAEYFEAGSLVDLLKRARTATKEVGLREDIVKIIVREVLTVIGKLHSNGVVVKSLKPSNLFITLNGDVKLLHFSYGKTYNESVDKNTTYLSGSPVYLAPEVIESLDHSPKSDVWSVGIIAMELFQGANPFTEPTSPVTLFDIVHKPPPKLSKPASPELRAFIDSCLRKAPSKRLSVSELLDSPFLRSCPEKQQLSNFVYSLTESGASINSALLSKPNFSNGRFHGSGLNSKVDLASNMLLSVPGATPDAILEEQELDAGQRRLFRKVSLLNGFRPGLAEQIFREVLAEYTREARAAGVEP